MKLRRLQTTKAQSTGWAFFYGLIVLFGLGVIYIVFSQVFNGFLVPTIKNMAIDPVYNIDNATQTEIITNIDTYMLYFNIIPFILFGSVIVYMFVSAIRKENQDY